MATAVALRDPVAAREAIASAALLRRSIREYQPEPLPESEIRELLRLAARAPSAWNLQPWRFIVVRDKQIKERLQAAANGQRQVGGAPAVVAVTSDMVGALGRVEESLHPAWSEEKRKKTLASIAAYFRARSDEQRDQWGRAQTNIALGYLLLIAETRGLATSPMQGFDAKAVRELLELPNHVEIVALVSIGRAAEQGLPAHRLDVDRLIRFI